MEKNIITTGFTNLSYLQDNKFVQEKFYTGFNHKIDYKLLKKFDFVPKLLFNSKDKSEWEYIKGHKPEPTNENLILIAQHLTELHNSDLILPPTNHAARVKFYRKQLKEKNINIQALNDFYKAINLTLSRMDKNKPLHNDLWLTNMIEDENHNIFFCDWEYATYGDIHFDLAYFIESSQLNNEQEKIFLNAYKNYDPYILLRHKILVNYLVILWAHSQKELPFDTSFYEKRLYILDKKLQDLKNN